MMVYPLTNCEAAVVDWAVRLIPTASVVIILLLAAVSRL